MYYYTVYCVDESSLSLDNTPRNKEYFEIVRTFDEEYLTEDGLGTSYREGDVINIHNSAVVDLYASDIFNLVDVKVFSRTFKFTGNHTWVLECVLPEGFFDLKKNKKFYFIKAGVLYGRLSPENKLFISAFEERYKKSFAYTVK